MKNLFYFGIFVSMSVVGQAQTVLLDEGFQDGIPASWSVFDEDGQAPDSSVIFVDEAWIGYESAFDTCAISTSFYAGDSAGQSMDYLVSPKLDLLAFGHVLTWESKSFDANYLESYYVMLSTTDSLPASFTDTILFVSDDSPNWKTLTANLFTDGFTNQSVYIAFKNASTDEFILGVDNVKLTTNDPATIVQPEKQKIEVYPNPTINIATINVPDGTIYQLFSLDGKKMISGNVYHTEIDLSSIPTGAYLLELQFDNATSVTKVIKQ